VRTITSQVQEDLPTLPEARQVERMAGAQPNAWRRLQDFSGSGRLTAIVLFLPTGVGALHVVCCSAGRRGRLL
jgi:hypothetical protein